MKLVINTCFGGFGLSAIAIRRLAELNGRPSYFFQRDYPSKAYRQISIKDDDSKGLWFYAFDIPNPTEKTDWKKHYLCGEIQRDDPKLIQVVEELGEKASGTCAKLRIVEIPDGTEYEISEYDGKEHVAEKHETWY